MAEVNWLEMFGYLASIITGVSLTMSSIVKLRWLNLLGAFCFGTYGVMIGAAPVAALNYFICVANIYYLWKMYTSKSDFRLLTSSVKDVYMNEFLKLNQGEIKQYFPEFKLRDDIEYQAFMIHQDQALAGAFIGHRINSHTLEVDLDFVLAPYRDMKPGQFTFNDNIEFFKQQGITRIVSAVGNEEHSEYLQKVGFTRSGNQLELLAA